MSGLPPERWPEVEAQLERLFGLDSDERARALAALEEADAALAAEVRSLLDADASAGNELDDFLAAGVAPFAGDVDIDETLEDLVPASGRLGPYRIDRVLGTGGMSVVYLGHRDDGQYEQAVAVKLLRHPGRHPELIRRFRVERQILAHLRHPNIARIVDGGMTPDGHPYLVMEHVDGLPVTRYCAAHGLSLDRRLELFETICEAVHHAHQHLIVHRDLKPSNILVNQEGRPKLLDFGIAKLLSDEQDFEDTVALPQTGFRLFTPDYAAPEQVRGDSITTATDVYALGVLLYELLSGERPYRLQGRSAAEIERVVCDTEPPLPSTAITRVGDGDATAAFDDDARRLRSRLKGDLDVITMKALRKEPEHRYPSARELADDLRRYRHGEPVSARPATASYRFGKFARRHRIPLGATVVVFLLTLAFGVNATVERARTEQARKAAEIARRLAVDEAAKSAEVTDFLLALFRSGDPRKARTDTLSVRDVLLRGVERVESLRDRPAVHAALLNVMGRALTESGELAEGERVLREAIHALEASGGAPADVTAVMSALGRNLALDFRYAEAIELQREILDRRIDQAGPDSGEVVRALNNLGQSHLEMDQYAAAESLLTRAADGAHALGPDALAERIAIESNLASLLASRGDFPKAAVLAESVLVRRRALVGEDDLAVAQDLHNLAVFSRRTGDAARAEGLYRESLAIKRERLPSPAETIARSLDNLAIAISVQGRYEEAEGIFLEALEMRRAMYGDDHRQVRIE